jgi:Flp pilus assembly protein TadB
MLGLITGVGVVLVVAGLLRRSTRLEAEIARYDSGAVLAGTGRSSGLSSVTLLTALGGALDGMMNRGARAARRDQELAITNRTLERHAVVTATATLVGLTLPLILVGLLATMGWHLGADVVVPLAVLGTVAGAMAPTIELRRASGQARERFLHGLSCWLELVALAQAGGMGVEGALDAAGRISPDAAFSRIRRSLERARHSGTTPWEEMGRLASEVGLDELDELAASLGLAGLEGARIRSSLTAKSASLRRRQLSEAEARANSTTERLFLPSIILMIGFMVFLMYPAGVSLAHVL